LFELSLVYTHLFYFDFETSIFADVNDTQICSLGTS